MSKLRLQPTVRLSIGLVALTLSILIMGEFLGLIPDKSQITLNSRKVLTETLSVQFALAAGRGDFNQIEVALNLLVKRNPEILSAAMRSRDGSFLAVAGDHAAIWKEPSKNASTSSFVKVPIMQDNQRWGTVELSYTPLLGNYSWDNIRNSFFVMLLFVAVSGFIGYLFFLKRALKELDPSNVVPSRVKKAFDTMTEGVLILDEKGQIMLANNVFCTAVGLDLGALMGKEASSFQWERGAVEQLKEDWKSPWVETLETMQAITDVRLCIGVGDKKNIFMANASPILGDDSQCKGVMVTFDDITELEDKNHRLKVMIEKLEVTRNEVTRQNDELKILAEIDPLTGCYNRRAFFGYFEKLFSSACEQATSLNCIMLDIDHFKSVNDNFGHQTGDEVIKLVSSILRESMRDSDIVGRYGGEEFCLVLPGLEEAETQVIAERIRVNVMNSDEYSIIGIKGATISLGISSIGDGVQNPTEMIDLADKALYYAKNNGRNRVAVWKEGLEEEEIPVVIEAEDAKGDHSTLMKPAEDEVPDVGTEILHAKIRELENLNIEQQKVLNHDSIYDSITGLPTRTLLEDRIEHAINHAQRNKGNVAVLSLSFDCYKRIQGTLGYKAAEKLIIKLSKKLGEALRTTDTISSDVGMEIIGSILVRKNDDGFYALIPELKEAQSITWIINRIYAVFSHSIIIEEFNVKIDSAIGVSMFPIDGADFSSLLKCADLARHYAETQGKNICQFYSDKLNNLFTTQLKIESELERAVKCDEFEVYYQPIVDVRTGRISKLEALLRWNHPEKQLLSAVNFVEVAEKSGQIIRIGDWVLREVIQQLAIWRREISQDISISVNISVLQLRQKRLVDKILNCLHENKVPSENLILEITETAVVKNMAHTIDIMTQLHDQGIKIALDDFGTGYSSLQYIQKFPVDIIKIDRSFVSNIESNANDVSIVSMIIDIAKKLGFTAVAEGVETDAQFKILCDMGCNNVQGYLVSRPIPKIQMSKMLQNQEACIHDGKVKFASLIS